MTLRIDGLTRLLSSSCLVAAFAAAPLSLSFDAGTGLHLDASIAHARGGDSGGSDDGADHDSGDDHGGSDSDSGGSDDGAGHDSGDDHGGRGTDRSNDDRTDDHNRRGGTDTAPGKASGKAPTKATSADGVSRVERSARGLEVTFDDGSKVEISNGRYERKTAAGRTVEQRRATQADVNALLSAR